MANLVPEFEGQNCTYCLGDEDVFGTKETTMTGIIVPFSGNSDITPKRGFVDHDDVDGTGVPNKPLKAKQVISGRLPHTFRFDATPWLLKHAIDVPDTQVDTPTAGSYTHTHTLGNNGPHPGLEVERRQSDATKKSRRFWAGRVNTMAWNFDVEGAWVLDFGLEFCRVEPWATSYAVASPVSYALQPVDKMLGSIKIDTVAVAYVASWTGSINWQLDTGRHSAGNNGLREGLARGKPRVGGTLEVFLNNTSHALITAAEAGTEVRFDLVINGTDPTTKSFTATHQSCILQLTGEPVETNQGLNCTFDWRCYGANAMSWVIVNEVATYA